jgi:hypothetical protein
MKHANRKEDTIELPFWIVESVLFVACNDFLRVTGGMPAEAHIFQVWCMLCNLPRLTDAPLRTQDELRRHLARFPGIRRADIKEQKLIGRRVLHEAGADPFWDREYKRKI